MSILLQGNDYGIDILPKNCENNKQISSSRIALAAARRDSGVLMLLSCAISFDEACSLPRLTDNTRRSDRDEVYRDRYETPDVRASMAA